MKYVHALHGFIEKRFELIAQLSIPQEVLNFVRLGAANVRHATWTC